MTNHMSYQGAAAKREVADEILSQISTYHDTFLTHRLASRFGCRVEISRVDNLNLLVKVGVGSGPGPRYFNVRISEVI